MFKPQAPADEKTVLLRQTAGRNLTSAEHRYLRSPCIIPHTTFNGPNIPTQSQLYTTASYKLTDPDGLTGLAIQNANLTNYDFSRQILAGAALIKCNLASDSFQSANLTRAFLRYSNLTSTNFADATILAADLTDATSYGFTSSQLYSTASYKNHLLGSIALSGCSMSGWNFASQDLTDAWLSNNNLDQSDFTSALLNSASLNGSLLQTANFTSANLTSASFTAARLQSAIFTDATLLSADLSFADLRGARDFLPNDTLTLRNTILPSGELPGIQLEGGESITIAAGPDVTIIAPSIARGTGGNFVISAGVTVTATASLSLPTHYLQNGGKLILSAPTSAGLIGVLRFVEHSQLLLKSPSLISRKSTEYNLNLALTGNQLLDAYPTPYSTLSNFLNLTPNGLPYFSTYDGIILTTADIIIKRTYYGDTNLDGILDTTDLAAILAGLSNPSASTWQQGDCNHDNLINNVDLALFLSAYNYYTTTPTAPHYGNGTLPEPTPLLLALTPLTPLRRPTRPIK